MKKISILILAVVLFNSAQAMTKVTCVCAGITWGSFTEENENDSFPGQLQTLLDNEYEVRNFEVGGCTMLKNGNSPYWKTTEYHRALQSDPNIVFIDLGENDSKWINRPYLKEIKQDCQDMIVSFQQLPSHPHVIVMLPVVSFVTDTTGIWDPAIVKLVIPGLQQAAYTKGVEVLDMHQLLINHPELLPDKIHPDKAGSAILAKRLYKLLMQTRDEKFDILPKLPASCQISSFNGYACTDFTYAGRACKVVKPKWVDKGHPWIWRARFWAHQPQTDIALLERGFHLVYCNVIELFGNNESVKIWNDFYSLMQRAGLSKKVALEGTSRGGVYALNWAAENPKKVNAVYLDNSVLDLRSWPGGINNEAKCTDDLEALKRDFQLKTYEDLKKFKGSPVNKVKRILKGKYPILILCADADEVVPPAENTLIFEQKVKALNGNITVIHKPGFKHHTHSFPNPEPIVSFILTATGYD